MLKVSSIGKVQTASNGAEYYAVTFRQINVNQVTGEEIPTALQQTRNVFGASRNDKGEEFKAETTFDLIKDGTLKVGSKYEGNIVRLNTTSYMIGENEVNTYKTVVFEGESAISLANRQLKANKACVLDDDGSKTAPENLKASALTETA